MYLTAKWMMTLIVLGTVYAATAENTALFQFTGDHSVQAWKKSRCAEMKYSAWPDNFTGACARIRFQSYIPGSDREEWPQIRFDVPARLENWNNYGFLSLNIYAEQKMLLKYHIVGPKSRVTQELNLEKGRNQLTVNLRKKYPGFDFSKVSHMIFYQTRPIADYVFYLGGIELIPFDGGKMVRESLAQLESLEKSIPEVAPELRKRFQDVQKTGMLLRGKNAVSYEEADSFQKEVGALSAAFSHAVFLKSPQSPDVCVKYLSSLEKVRREPELQISATQPAETLFLQAARGERESAQIVLFPAKPLKKVRIELEGPVLSESGACLGDDAVSMNPVGYIWCDRSPYNPHSGWYPDLILTDVRELDLEQGKYQPWWFEFRIPENQMPGVYSGKIRIRWDGGTGLTMPFRIAVRKFTLPKTPDVPMLIGLHVTSLPAYPPTGAEKYRWQQYIYNMMLDHRLTPDKIYRRKPLTVAEAKRKLEKGGTYFNICYVGEALTDAKLQEISNAVAEYKKAGIYKHAYLYCYDEAVSDKFQMIRESLRKLKKAFPDLTVCTTLFDYSCGTESGLDGLVDWWIVHTSRFPSVVKYRTEKRRIGWYTCLSPILPYANNGLIEYPAIHGRLLMGMMNWKYKPDGYLYYTFTRWMDWKDGKNVDRTEPVKGAPLIRNWKGNSLADYNGDGNFIYPGEYNPLPSIRLKFMADGIEDALYLQQLERALRDSAGMSADWKKAARHELAIEPEVVKSLTEFTYDPGVLLAKRERIARLLDEYISRNKGN